MQEQGKRLLLAVALGLGVVLLWNAVVHKDEPPPAQQSKTTGSGGGTAAGPAAGPSPAMGWLSPIGPPEAPGGEASKPSAGQDITLPYEHFVATFSSSCG